MEVHGLSLAILPLPQVWLPQTLHPYSRITASPLPKPEHSLSYYMCVHVFLLFILYFPFWGRGGGGGLFYLKLLRILTFQRIEVTFAFGLPCQLSFGIRSLRELRLRHLTFLYLGFRNSSLTSPRPFLSSIERTWDCYIMGTIWVVVKIMVPFWIPIIIRHLIFRVPKKGP